KKGRNPSEDTDTSSHTSGRYYNKEYFSINQTTNARIVPSNLLFSVLLSRRLRTSASAPSSSARSLFPALLPLSHPASSSLSLTSLSHTPGSPFSLSPSASACRSPAALSLPLSFSL